MRLQFFFLLHHLFPLLHPIHRLLLHRVRLFYQAPTLFLYLRLLPLWNLNSVIHRRFSSSVMWESMCLVWVRRTSWTCVQVIVRWLSMIVTTCCIILTLRHWVKRWLHCVGRGMSVSRCVSSKINCPFASCYKDVDYEKDLAMLLWQFDGHSLPEIVLSFVVLYCPFSHLYFA